MQERGASFKQTLNDAIRAGLSTSRAPAAPYKLRTRRLNLRPGINLDKVLQVADGIEDDEIIRKMEMRK